MILQALARYYDLLVQDSQSGVARPAWSPAKVSYAAVLSLQGELLDLLPLKLREQRGKKMTEVPRQMLVPEQAKKTSGVFANFLCENAGYLFGLDKKGKPQRTLKCFQEFRQLHESILTSIDVPEAKAIIAFLAQWDPAQAEQNPILAHCMDDLLGGANLVFRLDGGRFAHEVPEIRDAWEKFRSGNGEATTVPCLVCGERLPVARLHPSIKGVRGAQATGASIVSFNAPAYESYGRDGQQGMNAPVSEKVAFAYTTALNWLLADQIHRMHMGDTTIIYWAESSKPVYRDLFALMMDPSTTALTTAETTRDPETEQLIGSFFKKVVQGKPLELPDLDSCVPFCVLGLAPNAARLSVRFFLIDTFGAFAEKIAAHYERMRLIHAPFEPDCIAPWRMLSETVPPNSRDKSASPLLAGSVLRAILSGDLYPQALYNAMLLRIHAEHTISYYKAATIKACLLRKKYNWGEASQEGLTVAINEQCNQKSYVLGRLFSVLEKLQQDANPGINATIRDRYFTSACAAPGTVFPTLLRLSNHHISKSQYGSLSARRIEELLNKLDVDDCPFPRQLTSEEQGLFILGYYHQNKANYTANQQ